jgi:hypothetical protein
VILAASHIRVTALTYNPTTVQTHRVRPALSCARARSVLHAFLSAKLHRPLNRCTVPALQGKGCRVEHWVCFAANVRRPLASQLCSHFLFDRGGATRRITTIFFRETDQDHS